MATVPMPERPSTVPTRRAPATPPQSMGLGMWAWLLQRVSGVLLVASIGLHFVSKTIAPIPWPLALANDSLLIVLVVYHSVNGIRVVLIDLGPGIAVQRVLFWGGLVIGALVAAFMLAAYLGPRL